jgi:hypothetical protein
VPVPRENGAHDIYRCPRCKTAVWSDYGQRRNLRFVRVGTLDHPDVAPPDIHIFTSSKQPWVVLPPTALAVPEYYDAAKVWPAASVERRARAFAAAAQSS